MQEIEEQPAREVGAPPTPEPHPPRRFRARGFLAWALLLVVAVGAQSWQMGRRATAIDFYQFWLVGRAAARGEVDDPYAAEARTRLAREGWEEARAAAEGGAPGPWQRAAGFRGKELGTYSTPWLYTCFGLFATDDYDRDQLVFQALSLLVFVGAVVFLAIALGYPLDVALLAAAVFGAGFGPQLSDINVGNVNRLQVGLIALYLGVAHARRLPGRELVAGVLFGLAVALKPNLGFAALFLCVGWLVTGARRRLALELAGMALGGAIALVWSSVVFGGAGVWSSWMREVPRLLREFDGTLARGNLALARVLAEQGIALGSGVLTPLVLVASAVTLLAARRRLRAWLDQAEETRAGRALLLDAHLIGLGSLAAVLCADIAWLHYYLLAVPLILVLLRPETRTSVRVLALLATLFVARQGLLGLFGWQEQTWLDGALVCGGALLLWFLGLVACFTIPSSGPRAVAAREPAGAPS